MQSIFQQIDNVSMFSLFDDLQEQETMRSDVFYKARLHMLKKIHARRQKEKAALARDMQEALAKA